MDVSSFCALWLQLENNIISVQIDILQHRQERQQIKAPVFDDHDPGLRILVQDLIKGILTDPVLRCRNDQVKLVWGEILDIFIDLDPALFIKQMQNDKASAIAILFRECSAEE